MEKILINEVSLSHAVIGIGLVLDIAGALSIARGILLSTPRKLAMMATSRIAYNRDLLEGLSQERAHTILGFLFLTSGFLAQLIGTVWISGSRVEIHIVVVIVMIVISIGGVQLCFCEVIPLLSRRIYLRSIRELIRYLYEIQRDDLNSAAVRYNSLEVHAEDLGVQYRGRVKEEVFQEVCKEIGVVFPPVEYVDPTDPTDRFPV